jgi:hypothetical protein
MATPIPYPVYETTLIPKQERISSTVYPIAEVHLGRGIYKENAYGFICRNSDSTACTFVLGIEREGEYGCHPLTPAEIAAAKELSLLTKEELFHELCEIGWL